VQEVLIRANAQWQLIGSVPRPEAYVRKMIVNEYLASRRRSWRMVLSSSGSVVEGPPVPDPAAGYAEREAMLAELGKLPRRQRAVVVLRYYEGLSFQEIAEVLGCTPGTVRGHASRALAALRIELTTPSLPRPVGIKEGY
jgi:RNA polymerase sigma factor (sigma-70 family)